MQHQASSWCFVQGDSCFVKALPLTCVLSVSPSSLMVLDRSKLREFKKSLKAGDKKWQANYSATEIKSFFIRRTGKTDSD